MKMASGSDAEILEKIADLKDEISTVKTTLNSHVKPEYNVTDQELDKAKNEIKEAIKQGKDETKTIWEALMESIGLKDFFEAFKQDDFVTKVALIVGALGAVVMGKLLDLGKLFNLGLEKLSGRIFATGESGLPQLMTRQRADSLTSTSINPTDLTPATLAALQSALNSLTPEIRDFNAEIRQMKSAGQIKQIAKAVGALKAKLTPSPKQAIKDTATAIDKLNDQLDRYDPAKLPRAQTMRDTASAVGQLSTAARTLQERFRDLATEAGRVASVVGTS
ncbi:hypothetical protein ABZT34_22285 [Streptomyces sp. NPDC005329]|uniref:hypothetical protein n=1 Tax=Streptomyces sp. NPDC005329 TaxID=3157034 RepID=UPI0033A8EC2C